MKKTLKTILVYIGLVIGAGFASGREIMEYFNLKSISNGSGIICAVFIFMLTSYLIGTKASENNLSNLDEYINSVTGKAAPFIKYFMLIYMFCGLFVMFAGFGALIYNTTALSTVTGCAIMAFICFLVLSFDLSGVVTLNVLLVPLMVIGIFAICICYVIFGDTPTFLSYTSQLNLFSVPISFFSVSDSNFNLSDSFMTVFSAVCYASYNILSAPAVLVPLCREQSISQIRRFSVASGFIIGLLIIFIWHIQGIAFDFLWDSELPMLTVAALCGKQCKRVYTAVLFMAICTTAVSNGFGVLSFFFDKVKTKKDRISFSAILCLCGLPPALYGFSALVSKLYLFFGISGIILIIWIIIDSLR